MSLHVDFMWSSLISLIHLARLSTYVNRHWCISTSIIRCQSQREASFSARVWYLIGDECHSSKWYLQNNRVSPEQESGLQFCTICFSSSKCLHLIDTFFLALHSSPCLIPSASSAPFQFWALTSYERPTKHKNSTCSFTHGVQCKVETEQSTTV